MNPCGANYSHPGLNANTFSAGQLAFGAITSLGVGTIGCVVVAATAASPVTMIAFSILAVLGAAFSGAAVKAYCDTPASNRGQDFVDLFKDYAPKAIAGTVEFISKQFVLALVQGFTNGISRAVSTKIGGEPTVRVRY